MENQCRPGTIVSVRGREWMVLPGRDPEVLRLWPLTTAQGEEVCLFLPLEGERVRMARFTDPEPMAGGDATVILTLFDGARLSLRSGTCWRRRILSSASPAMGLHDSAARAA